MINTSNVDERRFLQKKHQIAKNFAWQTGIFFFVVPA